MNIISFLQERNCIDTMTSNELESFFSTSRNVYLGIDPTADSLHLGNLVGLVMLKHFQRFGHRPVLLLGGATGLIGDPSGKDKERPLKTAEDIQDNVSSLDRFIRTFLQTSDEMVKPLFVNNYDWYSSMNVIEFLRDVGKPFRMGPMLSKEAVKSRLSSEEGISFTEFSYQLLQGYDFFILSERFNVEVQVGGSDQYGNITQGIEFLRKTKKKTVYGLTWPLLTRSDGKKFGKSEKGAVWLTKDKTSPFELYQYLYRVLDEDVIHMLEMLTLLDNQEIALIRNEMKSASYKVNSAQKKLAETVTRFLHKEEGLKEALVATNAMTLGNKEVNSASILAAKEHLPNTSLKKDEVIDMSFIDVCVKTGFFSSKGEARRLIEGGGAYLNGEKVTSIDRIIGAKDLLKGDLILLGAGKKKNLLIHLIS